MQGAVKWYMMMALLSLLLAGLWHRMHFPVLAPQGFAVHFYQRVMDGVDGRSCPSYPVCSDYAQQALQKHGWLLGSWLLLDRLIHEHDDLAQGGKKGHMVVLKGEKRLYDPLSRNDFWLDKE